ncbi:MAG TPA: PfkB family carbohydrate kinase [Candidatus Wallbacteria bacterium]|nr:PfkB family carbohydrate kinase [Candidatus Wallbacteria bacterium]
MKIADKIISNIKELETLVSGLKEQNKKIVLCQGHFNVIHTGHLRFIEFAKKQGNYLIIALMGNNLIAGEIKDKFFDEKDRAHGVASLHYVDHVFVYNHNTMEEIISVIKPSVYVKGEEFSQKTDLIKNEIDLVEKNGGKVVFSSGDIHYAPTDFLEKNMSDIKHERLEKFRAAIKKQKISPERLLAHCDNFKNKHLLVIGDTIVDQYVVCDALGMSSEAPVLVVRELEHKEFVGGAAIVSRHVRALGARCTLVSLVGDDGPGEIVKAELDKENVEHRLIIDKDRPTTFKIRYMVATQKILRVSRLKDHHLNAKMTDKIIAHLDKIIPETDGIIVSDFCYGVITPKILDHISTLAKKYKTKLFGDVQSSSQIGNVAKFKNYYLIKPTEKEARIALDDKYSGIERLGNNLLSATGSQNMVLSLGPEGFIAFKTTEIKNFTRTQHFPALNPSPVDVVGAGDSLLTALSVASCAGADIMEAAAIGALMASIAVGKVGNIPVKIEEINQAIKTTWK